MFVHAMCGDSDSETNGIVRKSRTIDSDRKKCAHKVGVLYLCVCMCECVWSCCTAVCMAMKWLVHNQITLYIQYSNSEPDTGRQRRQQRFNWRSATITTTINIRASRPTMYPWYRESQIGVGQFCGPMSATIKTESGYNDCMLALDYAAQSKVWSAHNFATADCRGKMKIPFLVCQLCPTVSTFLQIWKAQPWNARRLMYGIWIGRVSVARISSTRANVAPNVSNTCCAA